MKKSRFSIRMLLSVLAAVLLFAVPAQAQLVDTNLLLLVDISQSIDATEYSTQQQGYIDAFNNSTLFNSISQGTHGAIGVSLVYWSEDQVQAIDWFLIDSFVASQNFATEIAKYNDGGEFGRQALGSSTGLGDALTFGGSLFGTSPFTSDRWVLDISGDGNTNWQGGSQNGSAVTDLAVSQQLSAAGRDSVLNAGFDTINGIVVNDSNFIFLHYLNHVIGGQDPELFQAALDSGQFGDTLFQKLLFDIGETPNNSVVPEPSTMILLGGGIMGAFIRRRKKKI